MSCEQEQEGRTGTCSIPKQLQTWSQAPGWAEGAESECQPSARHSNSSASLPPLTSSSQNTRRRNSYRKCLSSLGAVLSRNPLAQRAPIPGLWARTGIPKKPSLCGLFCSVQLILPADHPRDWPWAANSEAQPSGVMGSGSGCQPQIPGGGAAWQDKQLCSGTERALPHKDSLFRIQQSVVWRPQL